MQKISRPAFAFFVSVLLLALLMQGCGSSSHTQIATHTPPSTIVKNDTRTTSSTPEPSQYATSPHSLTLAISYISQVKEIAIADSQTYNKPVPITRKKFSKSLERHHTSSASQKRADAAMSFSATLTSDVNKCKNDLANANWWGVTIYLDHCSITGLGNVKGITTAAGGIAIALDAFGIGIPIAVAMGILNLYSGVLAKEDYDCGNNGAYLNVTWLIVAWVAPVC